MYKRIMIVVDETDVGTAAVAEGVRIAAACGASVVFIHVIDNYVFSIADWDAAPYAQLEDFTAQAKAQSAKLLMRAGAVAKRAGVKSSQIAVSGQDKATCIVENGGKQRCNLFVVGSHGRTTMQRLIHGSVVANLITLSKVPVLVCKPHKRTARASSSRQARRKRSGSRIRQRAV